MASMRKVIHLTMSVEVEGDDEPAHDFVRRAISAVRDAVKVGRSRYPDLTITVHKVVEDAGGPPAPVPPASRESHESK
jgi:hypothetical protein